MLGTRTFSAKKNTPGEKPNWYMYARYIWSAILPGIPRCLPSIMMNMTNHCKLNTYRKEHGKLKDGGKTTGFFWQDTFENCPEKTITLCCLSISWTTQHFCSLLHIHTKNQTDRLNLQRAAAEHNKQSSLVWGRQQTRQGRHSFSRSRSCKHFHV